LLYLLLTTLPTASEKMLKSDSLERQAFLNKNNMDTGNGTFKQISEDQYNDKIANNESKVFKVGVIVELNGSRFRIEKILRNKLVLKLLKSK